jgi:hypothetical protein
MMNNTLYQKIIKEPETEFDEVIQIFCTRENNGYMVWRDSSETGPQILMWTHSRDRAIEFAVNADIDTPCLKPYSENRDEECLELGRLPMRKDGKMSQAYFITFHGKDEKHVALTIHHDLSGGASLYYKDKLRGDIHITPEEMMRVLAQIEGMVAVEKLFEEGYITSLPTDMTDEARRHARSKDGN